MPVTLEVDRPLDAHIDPRLSPLTELACALHATLEPDHHPRSTGWSASFAHDNGRHLAEAQSFAPLFGAFKARYFSPLRHDFVAEVHTEIEAIAALGPDQFTAMTAQALVGQNSYLLTGPDVLGVWETTDFLQRMTRYSQAHWNLARDLVDDPRQVQQRLVSFLHGVAAGSFAAEWERVSSWLERERVRTATSIRSDPWTVFERLPLARVDRNAKTIVFEKLYSARTRLSEARVIMVPSVHAHPHTPVKHYPGFPIVVTTPISAQAGSIPDGLDAVMARLAALNEPTRLRICRHLLRMPASTTELSHRLMMTPQQTSRHLRTLREVGLVSGIRHGAEVRYRLELDTLRRLGTDVLSVLRV